MPKEISSGAVIFRKDKEILYLLLYKKARNHYRELWDFPRGNINKNETVKENIIREVKEETGIEDLGFVEDFKEKIKFFYMKEGKTINKEVTYYLAETKVKEIKLSEEHDNFKWVSYEEAMTLITFENTRKILVKANKILKI